MLSLEVFFLCRCAIEAPLVLKFAASGTDDKLSNVLGVCQRILHLIE